MKPHITTLILDFDGTLGDSRALIVKTLQETLATLHLPFKDEPDCAATIGLPLKEAFIHLASVDEEMGERCAKTYRRIFDRNNHPGSVPAFPHVVDTIRELHRCGKTLTIASSRGRDSLPLLIESLGITPYISLVLSANDVKNAKPHPEPVLLTLRQLGLKADETLVVGDSVYDIEMGKRAHVHTCGVTYGNGTRAQLEAARPEFLIDDFAHLLQLL